MSDSNAPQPCSFDQVTLGRSGRRVGQLGLGSSFGIGGKDLARAFDAGLNYFYWGTLRRDGFARGVRDLAQSHRDDMVVVVQSYTRWPWLLGLSVERALKKLRLERADMVLLGLWNEPLPPRMEEAARKLIERGLTDQVILSCHQRATIPTHAQNELLSSVMVRYNAAHPGAENDVFPHLPKENGPGVIAYTATCWGWLLDPSRIPAGEPAPRASDCYRFALTRDEVDLCLTGPRNADDLDEALEALRRGPMDADELAWMKRVGAGLRRGRTLVPWHDTSPAS
ncbi:MAG: hypothetical protein AAF533_23705 [Acidobacteriota bacterium]